MRCCEKDGNKIGESYREGLERFINYIRNLRREANNQNILICSHGTMLTIYFSWLLSNLDNYHILFKNWRNLPFGGLGICKNEKIVKKFIDPFKNDRN